ncbi:MAG: phytanoyl-CoA dioxygenase family protein [bacterium]|nr:phytanoyl-CoA dioxygenase family protein [bacterium]
MKYENHTVQFELLNQKPHAPDRIRQIDVHASPEELQQLDTEGYLVREGLFQGQALARLQDALDRLEAAERKPGAESPGQGRFWGQIPRHLMDKDEAFLDLLKFPPVLSVARAMMGPLVRLRGLSARISYPGPVRHETPWHQHLRVVTKPLPRWFSRPHGLDALIYLDDLNDQTGAVSIVPGSHTWLDREPPEPGYEAVEGEREVRVKAGGVVMIHSNLWHRGLPTLGAKRRMLIFSFTPSWLRRSPHGGDPPADGLTRAVLAGDDQEAHILLGKGGYT